MYEKMYYQLFNSMTRAMEQLEDQQYSLALLTLERAHQQAEQAFLADLDRAATALDSVIP